MYINYTHVEMPRGSPTKLAETAKAGRNPIESLIEAIRIVRQKEKHESEEHKEKVTSSD